VTGKGMEELQWAMAEKVEELRAEPDTQAAS